MIIDDELFRTDILHMYTYINICMYKQDNSYCLYCLIYLILSLVLCKINSKIYITVEFLFRPFTYFIILSYRRIDKLILKKKQPKKRIDYTY